MAERHRPQIYRSRSGPSTGLGLRKVRWNSLLTVTRTHVAGRHSLDGRVMDGDEASASDALDDEVVPLPARHELAAPAPNIDASPY
ncbi:MAG: hypothetical protein HZC50_00825 [Nitrospirae bacterium]|nr:hypothetical protein [Nitrospirota bacterium]